MVSVFFSKTKWFLLYNYKKIFTYDYSGNFLYKVGDIVNANNLSDYDAMRYFVKFS